ncbi:uncharacterized protein BP5553_10602 [Venustampulla echinocandica]|uniref:Uncharacterized protein n=1 Tax=Venustampulla echinocandica TaxID=2656787 RepID=A0A370T902_9HELO|nr:uncharacterized protein BP5553_10602 [Venustampulla echinocandica]RDL29975.1 hypothetical protein BP5553_10602 [Venustampulla echinocandica]
METEVPTNVTILCVMFVEEHIPFINHDMPDREASPRLEPYNWWWKLSALTIWNEDLQSRAQFLKIRASEQRIIWILCGLAIGLPQRPSPPEHVCRHAAMAW